MSPGGDRQRGARPSGRGDQGDAIANEYQYFTPAADGSTDEAGSFAYWTDPIVDYDTNLAGTPVNDSITTMVGQNGKTPPRRSSTCTTSPPVPSRRCARLSGPRRP